VRIVDLPRSGFVEQAHAGTLASVLRPPAGTTIGGRPTVPPALVVAAYPFDASDGDLAVWGRLASLGRALGAPVLVAASPALLGALTPDDLATPERWQHQPSGWQALRSHPDAAYLGVALPRFLLRLPYGADGEECDR